MRLINRSASITEVVSTDIEQPKKKLCSAYNIEIDNCACNISHNKDIKLDIQKI